MAKKATSRTTQTQAPTPPTPPVPPTPEAHGIEAGTIPPNPSPAPMSGPAGQATFQQSPPAEPPAPQPPPAIPADERGFYDQLNQWKERMNLKVITPMIGDRLYYYSGGVAKEDNTVAALCTAIEGPGRCTLVAFFPQKNPTHHTNVNHAGSLSEGDRRKATIIRNGSFELIESVKQAHLIPWREHCQHQVKLIEDQIAAYRTQKRELEARRAQGGSLLNPQ